MAIADDFTVAANGDIRWSSGGNWTVIEFHRFLQDLADDASASGNDLLDITDLTPSDRSTDNIITLLGVYNIDDTTAQHLYDGSIIQTGGDEIYDGITNFGVQGIYIDVMQEGALISPNFWTTGLNSDANAGISHRFMVKTRTGGVDLDGRRLLGINRNFGKTYGEFPINGTARGNNVLALTESDDLNNATVLGTVQGWTIVNTEGYTELDVDQTGGLEAFYSEWNRGSQTINDLYEYTKMASRQGSVVSLYGLDGGIFRGITHEIAVGGTNNATDFTEPEEVTWAGGGRGQLLAIDVVGSASSTKMWIQVLEGVAPTTELLTGGTSGATVTATGATARTISTPFVGATTGSAIIGSYGLGIKVDTLTASDKLFDLDNAQKTPPNFVQFTVFGVVSQEDRVLVGPEALGVLQEDQFGLDATLNSAGTTSVVIDATIPSDTPASGTIRIKSDTGVFNRVPYDSYTAQTFTIPSFDFSTTDTISTAANDVFISYIDVLVTGANASIEYTTMTTPGDWTLADSLTWPGGGTGTYISGPGTATGTMQIQVDTDKSAPANTDTITNVTQTETATASSAPTALTSSVSFTGVYSTDRALFIRVRDGKSTPIKTFETTGTLGSGGGSTTAIRTSDE